MTARAEMIEKIRRAGVVGAGGAGFPTYAKLAARVDTVIANGAESEPLMRVDQHLMATDPQLILRGLEVVKEITGAGRAVIALKAKHRRAIKSLESCLDGHPGVEIFPLQDFYPAGDEQVLVYEITGRLVPPGGLPLQAGVVVQNVETLLNVARAVQGRPVTEKYVAVMGMVARPSVFRVPVGTALADLLVAAGGCSTDRPVVIAGGPMMGRIAKDLSAPVTKTTKGIIVLSPDHPLVIQKRLTDRANSLRARSTCCEDRACTQTCPRYLLGHPLEPHRVVRAWSYQDVTLALGAAPMALLCSECGVCELYSCPMGISPRMINAALKKEIRKLPGITQVQAHPVHGCREYRKLPSGRLVSRLSLGPWDVSAGWAGELPTPRSVTLPLKQHVGSAAVPAVKAGDRVRAGDVVGSIPEGSLGAPVHASVSGTVMAAGESIIILSEEEGGR